MLRNINYFSVREFHLIFVFAKKYKEPSLKKKKKKREDNERRKYD